MLHIATLSHSITKNGDKYPLKIIENIDICVKKGAFLSIVGPNGCGKSTLLRIIAGLDRPTSGSIFQGDKELTGPGLGIGMVFQEIALLPWKTVYGNMKFGLANAKDLSSREKMQFVRRYMYDFGLMGFGNHYPHQVSGGMRQKVAIARTLINNPDVLLMDEPFAALDSFTRNRLHDFLLSVWKETGKTIIFVTHNIDEAVYLSNRIIFFSRRPARVEADICIDIPYPRDRTGQKEQKIRKRILALLETQGSDIDQRS